MKRETGISMVLMMATCAVLSGCAREDAGGRAQYPWYQPPPQGQYGTPSYGQPPPPAWGQPWGGTYNNSPPQPFPGQQGWPSAQQPPAEPFYIMYHGDARALVQGDELEVPLKNGWITIQHPALRGLQCTQVEVVNVVVEGDWATGCKLHIAFDKDELVGKRLPASIRIMGTANYVTFWVKVVPETPWVMRGVTKTYR